MQRVGRRSHLVAFINELMSTSDELETIDMVKLGRNLVSKEPTCTARGNSPRLNIFRVAPDQVAEGSLMRDLLSTSNNTNLVNRTNLRA